MEAWIVWISFLLSSATICCAEDRISRNHSIRDGENQTLVSPGNVFDLGFFSPRKNSAKRYVGIWYHNILEQTVVWVANRDKPISSSFPPAILSIQADGNLVLLDSRGNILWSTNVSTPLNRSTTAKLLDSGNLVLTAGDEGENYLWQSLDDPSDTLLPGMTIGYDGRTNQSRALVSWKDGGDPAPGTFTFRLEVRDMLQFFVWNGSARYWRSGIWDGQEFSHLPGGTLSDGPLHPFNLTLDENQPSPSTYFEFSSVYNNTRLVMDVSGKLLCYVWYDTSQEWATIWSQPMGSCAFYGLCGENSICSESGSCECMRGFEPGSPAAWDSGDRSGGCKRNRELQCGELDGFVSLGTGKLPDGESATAAGSEEECRMGCSKNCNCSAYAHLNFTRDSVLRCLQWFGNLLDVDDAKNQLSSQNLHIRLAASELASGKKRPLAVIVSVTSVAVVVLLSVVLCILWQLKFKKQGISGRTFVLPPESAPVSTELWSSETRSQDGKEGLDLPSFTFESVATATNHFSGSNLLGRGGFGHVYRGKLPGGEEIAAKRLASNSGQGIEEFKNEAILIAKLQHRNLVGLLGYCIERNEKILLYEYLPNKSLDSFLFDPERRKLLDWEKRFHIILGIARGLLYLHEDSRPRIIHRDLKPSNILLDMEMDPKISDFGMARIFGGNETQGNTSRVAGTYGYMSPEYALDGLFSVKSDVYSFGVILMEIVTGEKNHTFYSSEDSLSLLAYSWKLWNEGRAMELIDPSLHESANPSEVLKCIEVGLLCVQQDPADRPTMASILSSLAGEAELLREPKQPANYIRKRFFRDEEFSRNELTITQEGR